MQKLNYIFRFTNYQKSSLFICNFRRQMSTKNIQSSIGTKATAFMATNEPDLWSIPITLHKSAQGHNSPITINAVFQDTNPTGIGQRTVIFTHGSPGSHKDFKYITPLLSQKGIRVIGINWPGMDYSEYDDRLRNDNDERTEFVQTILDNLQLKGPLIFLGHSRGSENAFRLACQNKEKTIAAVGVNFVGFHVHKGVRPFWLVNLLSAIWEFSRYIRLQPLLSPLYKIVYDWVGLKVSNGHIVGRCLRTMCTTDFSAQIPFLNRLQANPRMRLLVAYSGKDFLVEVKRSRELLSILHNCKHLSTDTLGEDEQIIDETLAMISSGQKHMAIFFPNEGHFLQKYRCKLLADSIVELFETAENNKMENNEENATNNPSKL